jgi:hypothetical protein
VPEVSPGTVITGADAIAMSQEALGDLFPARRS